MPERTTARDTLYVRAPDLRLTLGERDALTLHLHSGDTTCSADALRVLSAFAYPRTLADGLDDLTVAGSSDWMALTSLAVSLIEWGVLIDSAGTPATLSTTASGFGAASVHIRMLDDVARCRAYRRAIERIVRPGDVVVDIGTGTGLLAMFAARCGAGRVYAIEAGPMAEAARVAVRDNGLDEVVEVVSGWSTRVTLPEPVDVIISEVIGDRPLAEGVVELHRDARMRFGHEQTRSIPESLELVVDVVEVPASVRDRLFPSSTDIKRWQANHDLDLSALAAAASPDAVRDYVAPQESRGWPRFAQAISLARVDLGQADNDVIDTHLRLGASDACQPDGVLMWFRLHLGAGEILETNPQTVSQTNHWMSPLWVCRDRIQNVGTTEWMLDYHHAGGTERCSLGPVTAVADTSP